MKPRTSHRVLALLGLLALAACAAPAAPEAAATQAADTSLVWPQGEGACSLLAEQASQLYTRPSQQAQPFAELEPGFSAQVLARSADGWVGFDPGVAQAANQGIFRLRWVQASAVQLSGDCLGLPTESWLPQPQTCYTMPMEPVNVYAQANPGAEHSIALEVGQFAAVLGHTANGWAQIDLADGNSGRSGLGWVQDSTLNLNGPGCGDLPSVQP